jgi:hypothetical protein
MDFSGYSLFAPAVSCIPIRAGKSNRVLTTKTQRTQRFFLLFVPLCLCGYLFNMKIIVDRIEDTIAVLVVSDNDEISFNLPLAYLPAGVKAGDHLDVAIKIDRKSREAAERRTKDLLDELTKNSDPKQKRFKL